MEVNVVTQRLHSSSFWGLPYRILNMNPKKELLLLWSLRVMYLNKLKRAPCERHGKLPNRRYEVRL